LDLLACSRSRIRNCQDLHMPSCSPSRAASTRHSSAVCRGLVTTLLQPGREQSVWQC
jgi:hypothetical protein